MCERTRETLGRRGGILLKGQAQAFSEVLQKVLRHTIMEKREQVPHTPPRYGREKKKEEEINTTHTHHASPLLLAPPFSCISSPFPLLSVVSQTVFSFPLSPSCLFSLPSGLLSLWPDCGLSIESVENCLETQTSVKLFDYNLPLLAGLEASKTC